MKKNKTGYHHVWFGLALFAVLLSFLAVFFPLIKIPVIGNISYWKAEPVAALIFLSGTLLAMSYLSKNLFPRLWLPVLIQLMSFGYIGLSYWWAAEQKGHLSKAVSALSSPVTNFTADLLVDRAAWQIGMPGMICSLLTLLLVSILSRSK